MKKLAAAALIIAASGASMAAMAADEAHAFYVRGQIGAGRQYDSNHTLANADANGDGKITLGNANKVKVAGRIAGGYKFNDTFSAELGYTQFSNNTATMKTGGYRLGTVGYNPHAIDALVKASLPITENIAVFGGAGAAYYTTKYDYKSFDGSVRASASSHAIRPEFTVGTSYKLNENVALDASFTQIIGKGNVKSLADTDNFKRTKYLPNAQLLAVGVSYSF